MKIMLIISLIWTLNFAFFIPISPSKAAIWYDQPPVSGEYFPQVPTSQQPEKSFEGVNSSDDLEITPEMVESGTQIDPGQPESLSDQALLMDEDSKVNQTLTTQNMIWLGIVLFLLVGYAAYRYIRKQRTKDAHTNQ